MGTAIILGLVGGLVLGIALILIAYPKIITRDI